jgi:hypothetical protein
VWSILFALSACVTAPPTFEEFAGELAAAQCAHAEACTDGDTTDCEAKALATWLEWGAEDCDYDRSAATFCLQWYASEECPTSSPDDPGCDQEAVCGMPVVF